MSHAGEGQATVSADPIVVATDFSDGAAVAVERAAALAGKLQTSLHVLHVFNDGIWATLANLYDTAHWQGGDPVLATRRRLSDLVADLAARHGIAAFADSATGGASEEISRFVREKGARLLVIGKQGENWIADAVLGETALKIVKSAEVPVLVARDKPRREMQRILVATDYSDNALRAANIAHELFPAARSRLLNAFTVPFEGRMRLAGATDDDIESYRVIERSRAEQGMRHFLAKLHDGSGFETTVTHGFPASAVLEAAAVDVDLVVVGRHGGSIAEERLLGSVTRNVLYHAVCDVLLVP